MKLIIVNVFVLCILCSFCQSQTFIVRWPEMGTFFLSLVGPERFPTTYPQYFSTPSTSYDSAQVMPQVTQEDLFSSPDELCEAAKVSNFFNISYETYMPDNLPNIQYTDTVIQRSNFFSNTSKKYDSSQPSVSTADILEIEDSEEDDFSCKKRIIKYNKLKHSLDTSPCILSDKKIIYFSKGFKRDFIAHFIFAKVHGSDSLQLLAAVGKGNVETEVPVRKLHKYYLKIWTKVDEITRINTYRKFTNLSRAHYVWLCAAIEDYKHKAVAKQWKHFSLIMLMTNNYKLVLQSSLYVSGHVLQPIPILGYRLKYIYKSTSKEIRIITPDASLDTPAFFVGFNIKGQIFLHNFYLLSSILL